MNVGAHSILLWGVPRVHCMLSIALAVARLAGQIHIQYLSFCIYAFYSYTFSEFPCTNYTLYMLEVGLNLEPLSVTLARYAYRWSMDPF